MSFPFRLEPSGTVATVEQNSDTEIDEQIALALLTSPGERIQVPQFGCNDPAFTGFETASLRRHLATFGPEVEAVQVGATAWGDDRQQVTVSWTRRGPQ